MRRYSIILGFTNDAKAKIPDLDEYGQTLVTKLTEAKMKLGFYFSERTGTAAELRRVKERDQFSYGVMHYKASVMTAQEREARSCDLMTFLVYEVPVNE